MMKSKMNDQKNTKTGKVGEAKAVNSAKQIRLTKDFTFNEFKKIADKIDLTQKEWSGVLHISERTLQRYAKDNSTFNFGVIDRILLIEKVFKKGIDVFGNAKDFLAWLKAGPVSIDGRLGFPSLASFDGNTKILNQLGRIEHGILA